MVRTELYINGGNGSNGFLSFPFGVNIPVSLNFNLADVRNPEQRKASFSKTINLLGTNEINKLFENIFEVNVKTQVFNKNLKTPVKYLVDGLENFSGDLQLIKINIKPDKSITYECNIIGDGGSLFVDIGEKLIIGNADSSDDLDFSDYDHTYDRATQIATRANLGTGLDVLYPFIDKGSNGGSDTVFSVKDFLPCFSAYEYLLKIISKTGKTFTSTFLESTFFKKIIVYPNIDRILITTSQLNNMQWYVGRDASSGAEYATTLATLTPFVFDLDDTTTSPFFDLGSQYSGGIVTINESGKYNVIADQYFSYNFTHSNTTVYKSLVTALAIESYIEASTDGGSTWNTIAVNGSQWNGQSINVFIKTSQNVWNQNVSTGEIVIAAGTKLRHSAKRLHNTIVKYYDFFNNEVVLGSSSIFINYRGNDQVSFIGTTFYGLVTDKSLYDGQAVYCNKLLPTKIKQKDIVTSIFKAFNLFVEPNPTNPNDLIIEPFIPFYNTMPVVDFENRTDKSKEQTINPNILEGKRYIYMYKEDKDYWNDLYKKTWNEVFGTEQIDVENDFIKADKKTELIFSPTPNVANYGLGIAHPRIYAVDNGTVKPIVPNIRLLYCDGVKQSPNPYTYKEFNQTDLITNDYLYAGHTNDPFNPTLDLNFGLPKEVYYSFIGTYFTDNNLYNAYHKKYLINLIDKDGKFVTKYLWLTPKDINKFSFRNRLFIDGTYYIVNKIENYTPLEQTSTKVELIKLLETDVFTPTSFKLSDSLINTGSGVLTAKLNSSLNVGDGIQNKGSNCVAIGNNIVIPESCSNVTVIGNNVIVSDGVSNSSVINTNDLELTQSDVNFTNGVMANNFNHLYSQARNVSGTGAITTDDSTLFCDTSGGNFLLLLPNPLDCLDGDINNGGLSKIFTFIKTDSSGLYARVSCSYSDTINGNLYVDLNTQYQTLQIQTDGVNWFII